MGNRDIYGKEVTKNINRNELLLEIFIFLKQLAN